MAKKSNKWDVYFNRRRGHTAVTINDDGKLWENMDLTHKPSGDSYIILEKTNRYGKKTYVRKYLNKDKSGVKANKRKFYFTDKDKKEIDNWLMNNKKSR